MGADSNIVPEERPNAHLDPNRGRLPGASGDGQAIARSADPAALGPVAEAWESFRRNRGALAGLSVLALAAAVAVLAGWISPHSPTEIHAESLTLPPFWQSGWQSGGGSSHWLGTDDVGRDLLSRLIHGSRVSLAAGFFIVLLSTFFGTLLGLVAGYFGGWVDQLVMRANDVLMALPSTLLAIVVVAVLGPSLVNGVIATSVVSLPSFIRLARASALVERKRQYVTASRCFGASHAWILFWGILPNIAASLIVQASLTFSDGILNVAALGFLGLGAQPPTPEWGTMLADSRAFIQSAPWLVTLPGLCILAVVLAFNLVGDGLRDALDPRLKR